MFDKRNWVDSHHCLFVRVHPSFQAGQKWKTEKNGKIRFSSSAFIKTKLPKVWLANVLFSQTGQCCARQHTVTVQLKNYFANHIHFHRTLPLFSFFVSSGTNHRVKRDSRKYFVCGFLTFSIVEGYVLKIFCAEKIYLHLVCGKWEWFFWKPLSRLSRFRQIGIFHVS